MKYVQILLLICACCATAARAADAKPAPPHEFTHAHAADWVNSEPLTLAALRGKVVLVEFWAFDCENCLNSRAWIEALIKDKSDAGLVVVSVHTPELAEEKSPGNVRRAVEKLGIHNPVMLDADYSYWNALHAQYWPTFYLIGRDGLLYGSVPGEMRVGDARARRVENVLNQLLAVQAPATG
jgi:thiol-disulfide isomerase/thioredoxin